MREQEKPKEKEDVSFGRPASVCVPCRRSKMAGVVGSCFSSTRGNPWVDWTEGCPSRAGLVCTY